MTPDELRRLKKDLFQYMSWLDGEGLNWDADEATAEPAPILDAADAWMEDLKNMADISRALLEHAQKNVRLCARIEELGQVERAVKETNERLVAVIVDYVCGGEPPIGEPLKTWHDEALRRLAEGG